MQLITAVYGFSCKVGVSCLKGRGSTRQKSRAVPEEDLRRRCDVGSSF